MGIDLSLLLELERILKLQSTHIECYKLIIVIQMLIYDNIILLGSINYLNKIMSQQKNQSVPFLSLVIYTWKVISTCHFVPKIIINNKFICFCFVATVYENEGGLKQYQRV